MKIENLLEELKDENSEARKLYEEKLKEWSKKLDYLIEANQRSQRFTAEDFNIMVY